MNTRKHSVSALTFVLSLVFLFGFVLTEYRVFIYHVALAQDAGDGGGGDGGGAGGDGGGGDGGDGGGAGDGGGPAADGGGFGGGYEGASAASSDSTGGGYCSNEGGAIAAAADAAGAIADAGMGLGGEGNVGDSWAPIDFGGSSSSGGGSSSGSSSGSGGSGSGGGSCSSFLGQPCSTSVNSCGMSNQGLRTCSGACSVVAPPSDASCPTPQAVFDPRIDTGGIGADGSGKRVGKGKSCTFSWSSVNATNCTLTGPGVNMSGKTGTVTSPPLDNISIYTLKCFNGGEVFATKTFTCSIAPSLIEI